MDNPNGIVQGNSQNVPTADVPRTRSTFPLGYHFFDTHRFGEYHPHYVAEGVKGDVLPIRSSHNVMSYTLKSPLLQNISMKKDYFLVPEQAILPWNWDKYFENPVRGDDVNSDVGPTVENFWRLVSTFMTAVRSGLSSVLADTSCTNPIAVQAFFRFLILGEYFYSNGSLLASLGCHGSPYCTIVEADSRSISYDKFFDLAIEEFLNLYGLSHNTYFTMSVDGYNYTVGTRSTAINGRIDLRHALSLMRDNPAFVINSVDSTDSFRDALASFLGNHTFTFLSANVPCRLDRLWAYQLVVAHYYSNDHIDFIFSADLFRQLIGSYLRGFWTGSTSYIQRMFFTYNGAQYQYDYLSAHVFSDLLSQISSSTNGANLLSSNTNGRAELLGYLSALFGYRRSLRYLDYFTGSRAQPLAVGSTGVAVQSGMVDVVDITRNIQRQRFLNAVNRVRHNTEGYLKGIFGGDDPAPDYHNPFFLAHTDDTIYGQETENTSQAQFEQPISISSNLRSNGSRYMFEMHCDRPCILIGITSYDLPRCYTKSIERPFFHVDRFDMFNPFMQFIGDQPLYIQELGINPAGNSLQSMSNFAYTLRNMEFKQRYNQAAGGFVENLPGFAFMALDARGNQTTINPDWIRSVCSEFDDFYVSLTGWSNGSYFHFIVDNFNDCSGSRPMAYAPSIL